MTPGRGAPTGPLARVGTDLTRAAPRRPAFARRLATAMVACGVALGLAVAVGARAAQAEPADGALTVEITDIAPAFLTPESGLTVRGTLHNRTGEPLTGVDLALRLQRTAPSSRAALDAWLDPANAYVTLPLADAALGGPLPAGGEVGFELEVPAGSISLPNAPWGPRGLEVRAVADDGATDQARTLTVWYPGTTDPPVALSLLVPLAPQAGEWTRAAADGVPVAAASADRIGALIRATAVDPAIAWGLDPALLAVPVASPAGGEGPSPDPTDPEPDATAEPDDTAEPDAPQPDASGQGAQSPATGATTAPEPAAPGTPSTEEPAPSAVAAGLRALLVEGARGRDVVGLAFADADVAAAVHASSAVPVEAGATLEASAALGTALRDDAGVAALPDLAWPAGARTDLMTIGALAARGTSAVVVAPGELAPNVPLTVTSTGRATLSTPAGDVAALVPDAALSAALAGEAVSGQVDGLDGAATDLEARQYLLAATAAIAREAPATPRTVLATLDRTFDGGTLALADRLASLAEAPWVSLNPLSALQETADPGVERLPLPEEEVEDGEAGALLFADVAAARTSLADLARTVPDPAALVAEPDARLLAAASAAWRPAPGDRAAFTTEAMMAVVDLQRSLGVEDSATVNLISASGDLPVTIRNDLDQPVTVTVHLTSDDPALQVPDKVPVQVPAFGTSTVGVQVHAVGSADVTVLAQLRTADGVRVGTPATFAVRVRAGWENTGTAVVASVVAGMLVVGLVRNIRRGRRGTPASKGADG